MKLALWCNITRVMKNYPLLRVKIISVNLNGALFLVWILQILQSLNNYRGKIFLQIPLVSNPILSQFQTCHGKVCMYCRSGVTVCIAPGVFGWKSGYVWGWKCTWDSAWYIVCTYLGGEFRILIRIFSCIVSCCLMYL